MFQQALELTYALSYCNQSSRKTMRIEFTGIPESLKVEGIVTRSRQVNVGDAVVPATRLEARILVAGSPQELSTYWVVTYRSDDGTFLGIDSEWANLKPARGTGYAALSMDISIPESATVAEVEVTVEQASAFGSFF